MLIGTALSKIRTSSSANPFDFKRKKKKKPKPFFIIDARSAWLEVWLNNQEKQTFFEKRKNIL